MCTLPTSGGPDRDTLTIYGSVSSYTRPYRYNTGNDVVSPTVPNTYDPYLLHNPPPYFPTAGSFQILDWSELSFVSRTDLLIDPGRLPRTQSVDPAAHLR